MKIIIQKSGPARVEIDNKIVGQISTGLVILVGITNGDNEKDIDFLCDKISNLRVFESKDKYFEKSISETSKEILVVSQFTLYANCKKGRRPDFNEAAKPEIAKPLYEKFIERLKKLGLTVQTGIFGADMQIYLVNNGPVTLILESKTNS